MKYKYFIKKEPIAYFKITEACMEDMKTYSRIMKDDSKDMLIRTTKDKNIELVMCDLNYKEYTWNDGVTVQTHSNSSSLILEDKSDIDFTFYATRSSVRYGKKGNKQVVMPVIVPPVNDYHCFIHTFDNGDALIEMRSTTHFFTFIINNPVMGVETASNQLLTN